MGGAGAEDLATTKDLLHLAICDLHAIDGLLAVELILEINGGGVGSPEWSTEKTAFGNDIPFFRLEIIKKELMIYFVKRRDVSSIGRPARCEQCAGLRQKRPLIGA